MTASDYPKCRTCRHFELAGPDGVWTQGMGEIPAQGYCSRIECGSEDDGAWLDGSDVNADTLLINPDKFGCILHEPVTTSP